jgi:hypothetical protein
MTTLSNDIGIKTEDYAAWISTLNITGQETAIRYFLECLEVETETPRPLYFIMKEIAARFERGSWPF